jgi:hypothetical protein
MNPLLFINAIIAVASFIAAACWLRSALIQVPNNIDTIVEELQRIGYWNGLAAAAACVAAFFTSLSLGWGAL